MYLVLPHTFPIVFSMGMIWFHTIAKPWECCVYSPSHTISISSKQRAIWYGNVLTLLHHSHIISLAYYCWYGNVMGGDKAPYHSHIIQAYSHWYGITMGGKTPPSRRKNGIWYWNDMDILDSCSMVCIWLKLQFKCAVFVFFTPTI